MANATVTEAQLFALSGLQSANSSLFDQIINALFVPRFVPSSATSFVVDEQHRGAIIRFTAGTAVAVSFAAGLPAGFVVSFLPYGAGSLAFAGTVGGTGSAGQYKLCSAMKLDSGEWLLSGGA
jgi:hypothetical protein